MSLSPEFQTSLQTGSDLREWPKIANITPHQCNLMINGSVAVALLGEGISFLGGIPANALALGFTALFIIPVVTKRWIRKCCCCPAKLQPEGPRTLADEFVSSLWGDRTSVYEYHTAQSSLQRQAVCDQERQQVECPQPAQPEAVGDQELQQAEFHQPAQPQAVLYQERQQVESLPPAQPSFSHSLCTAALCCKEDKDLRERSGEAAFRYLRVQRFLIRFILAVSILSGIIWIINSQGNMQSNLNSVLAESTISNLDIHENSLVLHIIFTALLFPLALVVYVIYHGSCSSLLNKDKVERTLLITGLDRGTKKQEVKQYFKQSCQIDVAKVFMISDLSKLKLLNDERVKLIAEEAYYKNAFVCVCKTAKLQGSLEPPAVFDQERQQVESPQPSPSSFIDSSIGKACYKAAKEELEKKIVTEMSERLCDKPSILFVTFFTTVNATHDYKCGDETHLARRIGVKNWWVHTLDDVEDVNWENLTTGNPKKVWIGAIFSAACVVGLCFSVFVDFFVIFLISLSSPRLSSWFKITFGEGLIAVVSQYGPGVIAAFVRGVVWRAAILPRVHYIPFHTKSKATKVELCLGYLVYLLCFLLLPSISLTRDGIKKFMRKWVISGPMPSDSFLLYECIFLPDSGAYFANYLIISLFLNSVFRFCQVGPCPRFFCHFCCQAKSEAERSFLVRGLTFNEDYPELLSSFSITLMFCFISPLVTLVGLACLFTRRLVDWYHLKYVFGKYHSPKVAPELAMKLFLFAVWIQLGAMCMLFDLRDGPLSKPVTLYVLVALYGLAFAGLFLTPIDTLEKFCKKLRILCRCVFCCTRCSDPYDNLENETLPLGNHHTPSPDNTSASAVDIEEQLMQEGSTIPASLSFLPAFLAEFYHLWGQRVSQEKRKRTVSSRIGKNLLPVPPTRETGTVEIPVAEVGSGITHWDNAPTTSSVQH